MIEANYSYDHSTNSYYRRNSHFFNISTLIISIMYYNIQVTEANF